MGIRFGRRAGFRAARNRSRPGEFLRPVTAFHEASWNIGNPSSRTKPDRPQREGGLNSASSEQRAAEDAEIDVFAIRSASGFTWEVRRFGGLVMAQGDDCFDTAEEARSAGQATLDWLVGSGWMPSS